MGPNLLCDKSTLQTLNSSAPDLLHHYFSINIPPILVREILGDLAKGGDEKAKTFVRSLARKIARINAIPNVEFRSLVFSELEGEVIEMSHRPIVAAGEDVTADNGEIGMVVAADPYEEVLHQWKTGDFSTAEMQHSQFWRERKAGLDWRTSIQKLEGTYSATLRRKTTLTDTLEFVDDLLASSPDKMLEWFFDEFSLHREILRDYTPHERLGRLPYLSFCVRSALFAFWSMKFNLVSQKADNVIDLEYLFYIPFCNAFAARDKFQKSLVPMILDKSQVFVNHEDLESDLRRIAHLMALMNEDERTVELQKIGPPPGENSVCHLLWQKFMRPGYRDALRPQLTPEQQQKLMEHVKMLMAGKRENGAQSSSIGESDFVVRRRWVSGDDPCPCRSSKLHKDCHGKSSLGGDMP